MDERRWSDTLVPILARQQRSFSCISVRNVAGIFQSQLDVKTCPVSVRPSVFSLSTFFWVHCFRLGIFFLLVSKSLRDVVAGAAPPDMKHQVSPADEPNQFASPICSSCFLSRFRPFFFIFFSFFFSPLSISKGGEKQGRTDCFSHKIRIEEP